MLVLQASKIVVPVNGHSLSIIISISIPLPIYPSVYLRSYLIMYQCIYTSFIPSTTSINQPPPIYLSIYLSIHLVFILKNITLSLFIHQFVFLSTCLNFFMCDCLPFNQLLVYQFVGLYVCICIYPSSCLSVYLPT